MTVCHSIRSNDPFVRFKKSIVYDSKISLKAKGLLSIAFSRPENWTFYKSEMMKHCSDGEHSFDSGIKELEDAGYLYRTRKQNKVNGQLIGWEWYFFEEPIEKEEFKKFLRNGGFPDIGETQISGKTPPNKNDSLKENEENNNKSVVVFPCLDDLKITSTRKQKLSEHFSEEDCKRLVNRVKAWKEKKNDLHGVNTILKNWGDWSDDLPKEDIQHQNEKFLDSTPFKDGSEAFGHRVTIGNRESGRYIEFVCGRYVKEFLTCDKNFIQNLKDFAKNRFSLNLK